MNCAHCCYSCGPRGKHAETKTIMKALEYASEYGDYITIGGGEPTLHPDFLNILMQTIATQEDGGPHIITNGSIKSHSLLLAKLAKKEVISAELSNDDWHDSSMVDEHVYDVFSKNKWIRNIRQPVPQGRALRTQVGEPYRKYECVCDDLVVDIQGRIWACGCFKEQFGTVDKPNIPDEYYERDDKCSNYKKRKRYVEKNPEVKNRWWI